MPLNLKAIGSSSAMLPFNQLRWRSLSVHIFFNQLISNKLLYLTLEFLDIRYGQIQGPAIA